MNFFIYKLLGKIDFFIICKLIEKFLFNLFNHIDIVKKKLNLNNRSSDPGYNTHFIQSINVNQRIIFFLLKSNKIEEFRNFNFSEIEQI